MKTSKLASLVALTAFCEASLPPQMRERRFRIVPTEPAPELMQLRKNQAEAKRARKAQIRRGMK